ncbi:MAG: ABC transporter substrate-binding protein [Gemmatimonadaceae bacterium]
MILAGRRFRAPARAVAVALCVVCGSACGDRTPAVVGIAMGSDTVTPRAILPARQQRFNDSASARHHVALRYTATVPDTVLNPALAWANELVRIPGLVGVVGHESSRSALQAAPVYRERRVVQIVPTGTSSELSTVSPWTFPLVASDASQGVLLAQYLVGTGRKRVTLFVQDDEYGRGIVSSVKRALNGTDVRILENVMHTPASDYELLVRSVMSHDPKPDALLFITQGGIAARVAKLAWRRDSTLLLLGTDAVNTAASDLRALAPSNGRIALATYWFPDSSKKETQEFLRDFRASHLAGDPQWHHAALYDAVGLLDAAVAEVGASPSAVRGWLLSLGRNRPAYHGVLGPIDFTGNHAIPARLVRPSATGWELVK